MMPLLNFEVPRCFNKINRFWAITQQIFLVFSSTIMLVIFQEPVLPPDLMTWILLIFIGLCGCLGHTTLNKGAQLIDASRTSVLRNADIAFVLLWQVTLLHELPTGWSFIGLILICSSTLVGALTKPKPKLEDELESDSAIENEIELEVLSG